MMPSGSWLSILLSLAQPAPFAAAAMQPSMAAPGFERSACIEAVATDEKIDCGVLIVAENRAKANSRAIRLPVMIFRSRSAASGSARSLDPDGWPQSFNRKNRSVNGTLTA